MDVPAEILLELKCHKCEMYLSRGPVYLEHGGAAACGRCFSPKRPAIRNKEYEAVAKLLRFPCKNRELGCGEKVGFVVEDEELAHDVSCSYRQYVCPVLGSSRCEWLGTRSQLLQHCQDQHPDHVLDNPCSLTHEITTSSLNNYVLQAYELLFLLLTKICVTSGKIYHSVRLLDASEMAKDFTYTLNIKRNKEVITKIGSVLPQGCLALQEPSALGLDINSLLSVLGGWGGVTFTVAVDRTPEDCAGCGAEVTVKSYRDEGGWRCEHCAPTKRTCRNQDEGCTHQDMPDKCSKHEQYFCQQRTECYLCDADVVRGTLFTHYTSAHVTHSAGSTWGAKKTLGLRYCLVPSPAGTAMCWYEVNNSHLVLRVYLPVLSERLCEYRCEIRVKQASTGLKHTYTPDITYKSVYDWTIIIDRKDFPSWTCDFGISVNINKI